MLPGPPRHCLVGLDELVVPQALPQLRYVAYVSSGVADAEEGREVLGRDVAGLVDELVGVHVALADRASQTGQRGEVDGRCERTRLRTGSVWEASASKARFPPMQ